MRVVAAPTVAAVPTVVIPVDAQGATESGQPVSSIMRIPTTAVRAVPPPPPAPAFTMPARLPDDRTPEQIGGKVAEVLWGYYGQQGIPGTPLTEAAAPAAPSPAYDDAYADSLLVEPAPCAPPAPPPPAVEPAPAPVVSEPPPPPFVPPPPAPAVSPVVAAAPRYQVFERKPQSIVAALAPEPVPVPVVDPVPEPVPDAATAASIPRPRLHVVQLGFVDGTTMDLAGDHPAAKALRAAAEALTLRG